MVEEKKKKDLIKKDDTSLINPSDVIPGAEEITSEDIAIPRIRLLQNLSAEIQDKKTGAEPGKLIHSITGKISDTIEFIPVRLSKTRIMFDADNRTGSPLCMSRDNITGSDGTLCKDCENAQWKEGSPPICNQTYNYLAILPEQVGKEFLPCIISFLRTSIQAAQKLNAQVQSTRKPFWEVVWKLVPQERKFKKGAAYILNVQQVRPTNETERTWAAEVNKAFGRTKVEVAISKEDEVEI